MQKEIIFLCDILNHVKDVQLYLEEIISELKKRGIIHDKSKFSDPEFSAFVNNVDKFKQVNYGSEEYNKLIEATKMAVDHHHKNNRHHTSYHKNGIMDMNLIDLIELICDWKAASVRSPNLTFHDSLDIAMKKYNIPPDIEKILRNTINHLGWS